jgi:hypothetical protein
MKAFSSILGLGMCFLLCCCGHLTPLMQHHDCIDEMAASIEAKPGLYVILTLDGQIVDLEEFFDRCDRNNPKCALYRKFYFWPNKVITIESPSIAGIVSHRIRAYYSPSSICYPERVNPLRIYGDVAEFYDIQDEFMGIAVYMGEGNYFPLPFSRYTNNSGIPVFPSITMIN